jgi:hypothetical protein
MTKLKIGTVDEDKPVILKVKLSAAVHRDLIAYSEALKSEAGQLVDPETLVGAMVARFMATDRAFRKVRRQMSEG